MTFDDWWGAYPTQEDYEANCRDAWEASAASRNAEVTELRQKLTIARELLEDCSGWLRGDKSAEGELRRRVLTFLKPAEES